MSQIVERYTGLVVDQLSAIPIGEALLLYLHLQDVLSTQPDSETLTLFAITLGTGCQSFADIISL